MRRSWKRRYAKVAASEGRKDAQVIRYETLAVLGLALTTANLSGQAAENIEQQLRSNCPVTRVGANGVVVQEGCVLTVLEDGIKANPASYQLFWPNNYKKGGRVKQPLATTVPVSRVPREEVRFLQVGEKAYLTAIDFKGADIAFKLQTCGACNPSGPEPNETPYRAELSFQFAKGYLTAASFGEIQDTIGQVLATSIPKAAEPPGKLTIPATYSSAQTSSDRLQLNADGTFSLQEAGQTYHGTFVVKGNSLELNIGGTGTKTTITLRGDSLIDGSGQAWVPHR